jgi:hypothetical protein
LLLSGGASPDHPMSALLVRVTGNLKIGQLLTPIKSNVWIADFSSKWIALGLSFRELKGLLCPRARK